MDRYNRLAGNWVSGKGVIAIPARPINYAVSSA